MASLKIHLGVPSYDQVTVELFTIPPAGALPLGGGVPPAAAPVLVRQVIFNIVSNPRGGEQLEYVRTSRAEDGIEAIRSEEYFQQDIDPGLIVNIDRVPDHIPDGWNHLINHPDLITPAHLITHIPERFVQAERRREAFHEAREYQNHRARELPRMSVDALRNIAARTTRATDLATNRRNALPIATAEAERVNQEKLNAENNAAVARDGARDAAVNTKAGEFPPIAVGATGAEVRQEIDRLARVIEDDRERLNRAIGQTNNKIATLESALTIARNSAAEIINNDRNSPSATRHYNSLQTNYEIIEANLVELERARTQIDNFLIAARAYKQRTDALVARARDGMVAADPVLAKVNKDIEIIDVHVARLTLLANQLQRETRAELQARIDPLAIEIPRLETRLANVKRGLAVDPPRTAEQLSKEIEVATITLKHYQYKMNHLVPIAETMPALVQSKVQAESRREEILTQETIARNVYSDATRMLEEFEASKATLKALHVSTIRAQKAHTEIREVYNRVLRTENTGEANTLLAKAEEAQRMAKEEYLKIRPAETTLLQKFAEITPEVVQALRAELLHAGNIDSSPAAEDALNRLVSTRAELRNELTARLPDANLYLDLTLAVDKLTFDIRRKAELTKLKNEFRGTSQFLDNALTKIKQETAAAKLLAEEYERKKDYFPVVANRAAADAIKKQRKAQEILDRAILVDTAANINRIRHDFNLKISAADMEREIGEINRKKDAVIAEARTILAASNAVIQPTDTARANSPSKWVDKWLEIHGEDSELDPIPPGRYTNAVRNIFEHLLNPNEAEPTVAALTAAADAARGPAMVAMGAPIDIPRAHAPVDDNPALTNKDIIEIVESTHTSLKQYALVKLNDRPRNLDALKDLDFGTRRTEKEKKALQSSEVLLEKETVFSKHEIRNPALPALVPGAPAPALPPGVPERIVDYIEQKFDTIDMFNKRKKEARVKHYKNSNESTVVSESAIRAQVTDVVNRIGFPPKNPLDYAHADPLKSGKFPVYYDHNLLPPQQAKIRETVIKVFVELGITERQVLDNVNFDVFPAMPAPAPRRRAR